MTELSDLYAGHIGTVRRHFDAALERAGLEHVVIAAGNLHGIFLDDMEYPFKVNPHFKYWAPVTDNPHCYVIYTPGEQPIMLFYQPVDFWHKPADAPTDFWTREFDLRLIRTAAEAAEHLPDDRVGTAYIGEDKAEAKRLGLAKINPKPMLDYLHYHRAWKTDYEQACLRAATRRGVKAHRAAEAAFREGRSEYEIHMAYLLAAAHNEHELPYGNIIALNQNASVLHYQHQARHVPENVHSFLIDAGAQFHGYASDITRTYSRKDDEFAELIQALDAAQQELCAMAKPGLNYPDMQAAAHAHVGRLLKEFGFLDLPAEDAVAHGLTRHFFPHGVGHFLGLQVHDAGGFAADDKGGSIAQPKDQPALRLTRTVGPGQVFTVEPGLYFIEPLLAELKDSAHAKHVNWGKVDAFRAYGGIRIEDNVIVTEEGCENMTRAAFAD